MRTLYLSFILLCVCAKANAQSYYKELTTDRVTINKPDEIITAYTKPAKGEVTAEPEREYVWYSAGRIHNTQGGYSGKLLNGGYSSQYPGKNLKEQGEYSNGLKNGEWRSWYQNGKLKEISIWCNGVKHGRFSEFDENGNLLKSGSYRNGLLHGDVASFNGKDSSTVAYYKNGKPAVKKKLNISAKKMVPGFLKKKQKAKKEGEPDNKN
ncbi:MORN repeat protein [Arcticibacter tournemirensis]|uniref:Toxin-antitoxin system YwqK family antitoxin n=1 Tax=Arcticibacter tournemirensis TaxID=699437 RepID=A0A5M9GP43_9SPHI|nr:hypothetical protein [Arcticibacter tournemirensis]KAA8476140.1 hypothetical protein F1649_20340 [Arcticibacter tournemirensis]TQM50836.1 MORN repeat protein [Arcticibacter tournemirensis]